MGRQPTVVYKYRAFNTWTLESLCNDTLHFALPNAFNDPMDCHPHIEADSNLDQLRSLLRLLICKRIVPAVQEHLKSVRIRGKRALIRADALAESEANRVINYIAYCSTNPEFTEEPTDSERGLLAGEIESELLQYYGRGVCCFSEKYNDPLMWSHYADCHRGLCLGYGTDRVPAPHLQKVIYGGSRAIKTSILHRAFILNEFDAKAELDRQVLLRKAKGWRYENESRLIGPVGVQDSPLALKYITFGLRCGSAIVHTVVEALARRKKPLRYYAINEVYGKYALRRTLLNTDDLAAHLPRTSTSPEEFGLSMVDEFLGGIGAGN